MLLDTIYAKMGPLKYPLAYLPQWYTKIFLKIDLSKQSPARSIAEKDIPIFIIHSEKDSQIPALHAEKLLRTQPRAQSWVIEAGEHGQLSQSSEYQRRIVQFFEKNL
ncbi:MAG: alpha/beta hydrolase [Candidatus Ancaeobacter aquaticus]|nr:alpha/beta hydrolase [Candidatus Ancaeobacter aquaticus]